VEGGKERDEVLQGMSDSGVRPIDESDLTIGQRAKVVAAYIAVNYRSMAGRGTLVERDEVRAVLVKPGRGAQT
jgi:hypothetical protein